MKILLWLTRLIAAGILLQTLFFKFTAAPESVYIFETLGLGAPGRIGSGIAELIAAVLLLWPTPALTACGALLTLGVMGGAIMSHLSKLGIVVQDDGGTLFALALVTALCAAFILFHMRTSLPVVGARFFLNTNT